MKTLSKLSFVLLASLAFAGCKDKKDAPAVASSVSAAASASAGTKLAGLKDKMGLGAKKGSAVAHLPKDCAVMGVADVSGTLKHPAIAESIVPKLKEALEKERANKEKSIQAFMKETGLDPLKDIHSVAVCVRDMDAKTPSFLVIVGGVFKAGSVLPALQKTSKDSEKFVELEVAGVKTLGNDKKDKFVAQTKDGLIVVANNKALLEAGLGTSSAAADAKLPVDKTTAFIVDGQALQGLVKKAGANPLQKHLVKMKRVTNTFDLAAGTTVTRVLMPSNESAIEFGSLLKTMLEEMKKKPQGGPPGIAQMIENVKISYEGAELVATSTIPADAMKQLIGFMATAMTKNMK